MRLSPPLALVSWLLLLQCLLAAGGRETQFGGGDADSSCACDKTLSLAALVATTKTAVVTVHVYDQEGETVGQASGWFVTPTVIVSTRHSFWKKGHESASYAKIETNVVYGRTDSRHYVVKAVLVDNESLDLVLLEVIPALVRSPSIQASQSVLPVSTLPVSEGESVFVISTPLGLPGVVSSGIISAIHNEYDLQFTAPISTGSSGAPILNYQGEVVGIVSGHLTEGQSINFGLSVTALATLISQLRPTMDFVQSLPAPDFTRTSPQADLPSSTANEVTVWGGNKEIPLNSGDLQHLVQAVAAAKQAHPGAYAYPQSAVSFAASLRQLSSSTLRDICYPTLHDWAQLLTGQLRASQEEELRKQNWFPSWEKFAKEVQAVFTDPVPDAEVALVSSFFDVEDEDTPWPPWPPDSVPSLEPNTEFVPSFEEPFSASDFNGNLETLKRCLAPDPSPWRTSIQSSTGGFDSRTLLLSERTPPLVSHAALPVTSVDMGGAEGSSNSLPIRNFPVETNAAPTPPPFRFFEDDEIEEEDLLGDYYSYFLSRPRTARDLEDIDDEGDSLNFEDLDAI